MITLTNFKARWRKEFDKNPNKFPSLKKAIERIPDNSDQQTNWRKSFFLKNQLDKDIKANSLKPGFNGSLPNTKPVVKSKLTNKSIKDLSKRLIKSKLGLGIAGIGALALANKIRKARSDKGKTRGSYNK